MSIINYLTTIRLAEGALASLGDDLKELKIKHPMIISDAGIVSAGLVDRLREIAPVMGNAPLFSDVPTNPTEEASMQALELYRTENCDGIVVLGGGSPIDLAKAVALLATHSGELSQYALVEGGLARITPAVAPLIAIPTTAGTGSEVGRGALITLKDGRKIGVHLAPSHPQAGDLRS